MLDNGLLQSVCDVEVTMRQQLQSLFDLQKIDLEITRINNALAALNDALDLRKKLAAAKKRADTTHQNLIDTEMQLKNNELELKTVDTKRAAAEKKLFSGGIMSIKESTSLEKEIDHLKNQQNELDGLVLELFDKVETLRQDSKSAAALVEQVEKQVKDGLAKEAVERKRLEAELAKLTPVRESMVATITDRQALSRYEAIRKKTGNTAVARIVEHRCEGCKVAVTSFTLHNVYDDKNIEYCENCGRILVLESEDE